MSLLPQLLLFAATLAALLGLSRWITRQVQVIGLRMTGSSTAAVMGYYLILFPGILLHELSHLAMARLLGLKVGKFSLGPRRRRNAIELGSVTVGSGGVVRDSLVGLAPFVAGTAVLLLVSFRVFDVGTLGRTLQAGGWPGVFEALGSLWPTPDFWLWTYVIFVVSNAMTPSPSDRQPWLVAGIYMGAALLITWLLGGLPQLAQAVREEVVGALQILTMGFMFTVAVNLVIAVLLWTMEALIVGVKQSRR